MFCSPPRYNLKISIHALLAESDRTGAPQLVVVSTFLSTLSLRRATMLTSPPSAKVFKFLSTLSLRRATTRSKRIILNQIFLSTLSLRRATVTVLGIQHKVGISIHALLAESDISQLQCILGGKYFYPRSPCGERLQSECPFAEAVPDFYPRSPCGERRLGNAFHG